MAKQQQQKKKIGFQSIKLFKDQTLGIGSFGKVCKAKCDDLLCAAKLIHETLFDPTAQHQIAPQQEHRLPIKRFELECEFLSTVRHPNIVQYLGMCQDPDTGLPVLLMELMDDSLTHFLESSPQPIPYHIQVNVCHDITLALSFLHSNSIVHRDLSSNNVLLIGNIRAKVTDFGMARLGDLNPQATHVTFTMCPGTDVYMPPEAVDDKPVYTEKIDCFSSGVIIIQILTQQFPKPGDRLITVNDPRYPQGALKLRVPEVERRQNHIREIDPNHPLLQIALDCLKDRDIDRPSAQQLFDRVVALKECSEYRGTQYQITSKHDSSAKEERTHVKSLQQIIQSQLNRLDEKDKILRQETQRLERERDQAMETKEEIVRQLRQETQQLEREKDQALVEKERQLRHVNQQLEESKQVIADFERQITELKQQLSHKGQSQIQHPYASNKAESKASIKSTWREGGRAPFATSRLNHGAIVENSMVYLLYEDKCIHAYNINSSNWSPIPQCPLTGGFDIVAINGLLTTVGGYGKSSYGNNSTGYSLENTNKLFSLTGKSNDQKWTEEFPPMPTKRYGMIALCTGTALIVAGGTKGDIHTQDLKTVEVMNTETRQWSTAAYLPEPLKGSSITVCGDCVYLLGGWDKDHKQTKSVYSCSLSTLLFSCGPMSLGQRLASTLSRSSHGRAWSRVANLPVTFSTCVSLHGQLLAIGGKDSYKNPTAAIHMYNPTTDSWEVISHMTTPRYLSLAAILPDNQLMVVGGWAAPDNHETDSVEFC